MNKSEIRQNIVAKRDLLDKNTIEKKSNSIKENLFSTEIYKNAETIFSFISFGSEVGTHTLIKEMLKDGKKVGVPFTYPKNRKMTVSEIKDFDKDLEKGFYNILSPREEELKPIDPKDIDLVLVPGLGFDKKGYRVGYGGGYYDTFFEKVRDDVIKIGICFELQIIDSCPIDIYDVPVDYIITESNILKI